MSTHDYQFASGFKVDFQAGLPEVPMSTHDYQFASSFKADFQAGILEGDLVFQVVLTDYGPTTYLLFV